MNPDSPEFGKRAASRPGFRAGDAPEATSSVDTAAAQPSREAGQPQSSRATGEGPLSENARPSGRRLIDQVKDKAATELRFQKRRATAGLGGAADAVRETGQQLRDERHDGIAQLVDEAAAQLERFSSHVSNSDFEELVADAERFARQQPVLFIGSSFAAGLLAARFFRATDSALADDNRTENAIGWRDTSADADGGSSDVGGA